MSEDPIAAGWRRWASWRWPAPCCFSSARWSRPTGGWRRRWSSPSRSAPASSGRSGRAARVAVEQARDALGETRAGMAGPGTTLAQLLVLLNAAARTGAATLTLYEIESRSAADPALQAARREALAALRDSCNAVGRELIVGRGEITLDALRDRLDRLAAPAPPGAAAAAPLEAERLALAQALRHLESARETLPLFFGRRHRLPDLLRLPFANRRPS